MKFAAELCMAHLIYLEQRCRGISLKIPEGGYKNVIKCQAHWKRDHIGLVLTTVGPWSGSGGGCWSLCSIRLAPQAGHPSLPYSIIIGVKQPFVMLPTAPWSFSYNHDSAVLTCEHCWLSTTNQGIGLEVCLYLCVGGNSICRIKVDPSEPPAHVQTAVCTSIKPPSSSRLDWTWKCPAGLASITFRMRKLFPPPRSALHCESGSSASLHFPSSCERRCWEAGCENYFVYLIMLLQSCHT